MITYVLMNFKPYQHVIFDFDKTLATLIIDWSGWEQMVATLIKKYQPDFDENTQLHMYSINEYVNQYGKAFYQDYADLEIALEREHYQGYEVVEKSFNLLQKLHQQQKILYLLTSNSQNTVIPILKELGVFNYFSKIVALENVENLKPSSMPFKLISNGLDDKNTYLMIGDSRSDRGFAHNTGIAYLDIKDF